MLIGYAGITITMAILILIPKSDALALGALFTLFRILEGIVLEIYALYILRNYSQQELVVRQKDGNKA